MQITTRRDSITARVRIGGIRRGVLFVSFHYGYWDLADTEPEHRRAANELTLTAWDPASKQPLFKIAAARVRV